MAVLARKHVQREQAGKRRNGCTGAVIVLSVIVGVAFNVAVM
jgi:hypothetical protein